MIIIVTLADTVRMDVVYPREAVICCTVAEIGTELIWMGVIPRGPWLRIVSSPRAPVRRTHMAMVNSSLTTPPGDVPHWYPMKLGTWMYCDDPEKAAVQFFLAVRRSNVAPWLTPVRPLPEMSSVLQSRG